MVELIETADGSHSLLSSKFGVTYHSRHGAVQETQHVFINAGLIPQTAFSKKLSVLEIGFGSGLNVFMTYLAAKEMGLTIDVVTYEAYPISIAESQHLNYTDVLDATADQAVFDTLHQSTWGERHQITPFFSFQKNQAAFQSIEDNNRFDIVYFDAFAPNAQPELWESPLMEKMFAALKTDGVLTTYCAKGVVKRTLKSVGFEVEAIPGPPGKREMTRAWKR